MFGDASCLKIYWWGILHFYRIKYIDKDNGAFSDSAIKCGGRLKKNSSAQEWFTTINHLEVDHMEN